jgi:hypothetical protein
MGSSVVVAIVVPENCVGMEVPGYRPALGYVRRREPEAEIGAVHLEWGVRLLLSFKG